MPELPEAETIARNLHRQLVGGTLDRVVHLRRDIVRNAGHRIPQRLRGASIDKVTRRGKRVVIHFEDKSGIVFMLGMSGYLTVDPSDATPRAHTHLRMTLRNEPRELRFSDHRRFGGVRFFDPVPPAELPPELATLGPEPLEITARQLRGITARQRQIKPLLMDQHAIAGLGNIYCDEALHRAGIHPVEVAAAIEAQRISRLSRALKRVLREAIRAEGSTIISYQHPAGNGQFQNRLRVYGREGDPCRCCRTPIERIIVSGRSTHFCPRCQPAVI